MVIKKTIKKEDIKEILKRAVYDKERGMGSYKGQSTGEGAEKTNTYE